MNQYDKLVGVLSRMPEVVAARVSEQLQSVSISIHKQSVNEKHFVEEVERPQPANEFIDKTVQEPTTPMEFRVDLSLVEEEDAGSSLEHLQRSNKSEIAHKPIAMRRFVDEESDTSRNMSNGKHDYRIVNHVVQYSLANPEHPEVHAGTTIRSRKQTKPIKLQQIETKRKNLLGQLTKLQSEMQEIASAKNSLNNIGVNPNDPSMKALELVRKMNEERKRREERVRIETQRIKQARAQRQEIERRRQEEIDRLNQLKKLQQEAEERRRQEELALRKQRRQAQEVRQIAQGVVKEIVNIAVGEQSNLTDSRSKQSNSSSVFVLNRNQQSRERLREGTAAQIQLQTGRSRARADPTNRGSNSRKKQFAQITLKLDKKKHFYPTNIFREQILQQERRRRQLQRQLQDQRRKVVDMRRLHNLPPIRPRDLQSLDSSNIVLNQSLRQSGRYGTSRVLLKKEEPHYIEDTSRLATVTLQTEQAEVVKEEEPQEERKLQDEGVQYQPPEQEEPQIQPKVETKGEAALQPQLEHQQETEAKRLATNESQISQEPEMQFFKSSNPVPEDPPTEVHNAHPQPQVAPLREAIQQRLPNDDEIRFYQIFDYSPSGQNEFQLQRAINFLATKGQTLRPSPIEQYDFDF